MTDAVRDNAASITLNGVTKNFSGARAPALDGVSAAIRGGGITGLAGPDGAGKTTLIRIICGLLLADGGSVDVCGADPGRGQREARELIACMPQRFGLYEDLSVIENLRLTAELRGITGAEREERFERLLAFTRLAPFTGRLTGALSGGMKQKLALACTLLAEPRVLLLDEPGVGVDPVARRELWGIVRELVSEERVIVWSTAYLNEAEACDSVLLLNEGRALYYGPPSELSARARGSVFLLSGAGGERRKVTASLALMGATVDAAIQGSRVRLVASDGGAEAARAFPSLEFTEAEPRFEDAFMGILGGMKRTRLDMRELFRDRFSGGSRPEEIVRAENLVKKFGSFTAADGISFSIKQGEIFGLLGPNGAGKSTTFKMMCGLLPPTSGKCSIGGWDFSRAPGRARARLGYMAQRFSLYGELSAEQNLNFFAGVCGMGRRERKRAIGLVMDAFDLARFGGVNSASLPLGCKQRLSMACAIIHGPDALFLDEPTSGVDPVVRREFWSYINSAVELGVAVLVTTHFMDEAEYCDRIAMVYNGRVIASGSPDEIKAGAATEAAPDPTMEDAFISLIERSDAEKAAAPS